MKESITKFDLEAAFKALDDLDIPVVNKIKANRPALTEIFSSKSKFDYLTEEYYDVSSSAELDDAKEAREAEVAKAKLARIEKIVDLDADSPEDLLTSYVGKYIMQCPQCMTLFYKDKEDIVESEDDPSTVNINEVCQHCGNETGYTLIGKVGEATAEEAPEFEADTSTTEENDQEEDAVEEEAVEENTDTEDASETELEDLGDLEELDLNIDEDEEKTEESLLANHGESLVEELNENADLEVSASEFEELINTPEFKKPVSDTSTRAILNTEKEDEETASISEAKSVYTCTDCGYTVELEPEEFTGQCPNCKEHHGSFDKVEENVQSENKPLVEAITRAGKCNEVLNNAVDKNGQKKYNNFIVCCFENVYSSKKSGKKVVNITKAIADPVYELNKGYLTPSKEYGKPEVKNNYKDAENIAKGRSMQRDCGPAFIFLAKDDTLSEASFLCQFFNGVLHKETDQLETYLKDIKGAKKAAKGGSNQSNFEKKKASEILAGKTIKGTDDKTYEVTAVAKSELGSNMIKLKLKNATGEIEVLHITPDTVFEVARNTFTSESLNTVMSEIEELKETALEGLIANSLVEKYGNVAGFRLTECAYTNNNFTVNGTIYFTSGATRNTTYTFTESYQEANGKISMRGLNEKLGVDKQFMITGYTNDKTFIVESFETNKTTI